MIELSSIKNIHCIGIGGIGLSAIADILMGKGFNVSGSDMKESQITKRLVDHGANIFCQHKEENVFGKELVVYSAAVSNNNPEILKAKALGIPTVSRSQMLGLLMKEYKNSIAVSGTHGKTTTTSMVSLILKEARKEPTILVGGDLKQLNGNVYIGDKDYFVTEACEYVDSFLDLAPTIEIILNIDSDHLDYFRNIEHIVDSFKKFTSLVPKHGKIIAYSANPFVNSVTDGLENIVTFGLDRSCDYRAENLTFNNMGLPTYELWHKNEKLTDIALAIPGEYNILNSLAAIACAYELGVGVEIIRKTLENFGGTKRRFTVLGTTDNGVRVIDDYAHHPTEIKEMLRAVKNMRHKNIFCLFQPHTYTRTIALFDEFSKAFHNADKILLAEIYAAREENSTNLSSKKLADAIKKENPDKEVLYFAEFDEIVDYINENAVEGDVVITTGAGDINTVGEMLLK